MASSNKLFIRIPHSMSSAYLSDAIDRMQICKVRNITIKQYSRNVAAVVVIDRWFKHTDDIRENLMRGEAMYIPTNGHDLIAKKYAPTRSKHTLSVDEFGRDNSIRNSKNSNKNRKSITDDTLSRRQSENARAAAEFISEYCQELVRTNH